VPYQHLVGWNGAAGEPPVATHLADIAIWFDDVEATTIHLATAREKLPGLHSAAFEAEVDFIESQVR
jgi:hypothetical protein